MVAWFKHDIPAWMDGTEALDDGPYRAYHVICQLIYLNDGPIALNEHGIAGRCNQHILAFRRHLKVLIDAGKLLLTDGRLSNDRAATELQSIANLRATSAKGGRGSAGVAKGSGEGRRGVAEGLKDGLADKPLKSLEQTASTLLDEQHHKSRVDKIREEDIAREDALPLPEPARKERRSSKRAETFPSDFTLAGPQRKYAADHGFADVESGRMFERFKNHHTAKGSKFVDWLAAWRNWVTNQVEYNSQRTTRTAGGMDPRL